MVISQWALPYFLVRFCIFIAHTLNTFAHGEVTNDQTAEKVFDLVNAMLVLNDALTNLQSIRCSHDRHNSG